eukprot:TRINITY_DN18941_c0_g1_i1.p1 TRINITY_DN18941_c0_g1~~TRINITY_DN18941_c0_g1_i1.p1  ORF type:complete len:133 (+),score=28.40 TRINITY_DN18941_c0_g1_i1:593-991(+)
MDVGLPLREELVELLPVSGTKCPVHGGGHVHSSISLGNLRSHQLRLDHIYQELLDLILLDLDAILDLSETDLTPVLCQLHEGQQLHFPGVVFVLQPQPIDKLLVPLVELSVHLQLLEDEDVEQVVDELSART